MTSYLEVNGSLGFYFQAQSWCQGVWWQLKGRLYKAGVATKGQTTDLPTRQTLQADRLRDNHTPQVKDSPLFTGISIVCTPPDVFTLSGLSWLGIVRTACWGLDWLEWIFNNPKISWKIRPSWRSDASLKFLPSLAFTFSHSRTFLGHLLFW